MAKKSSPEDRLEAQDRVLSPRNQFRLFLLSILSSTVLAFAVERGLAVFAFPASIAAMTYIFRHLYIRTGKEQYLIRSQVLFFSIPAIYFLIIRTASIGNLAWLVDILQYFANALTILCLLTISFGGLEWEEFVRRQTEEKISERA